MINFIKVYCLDCKKPLSKWAYLYGHKRCVSCSKKFLYKNSKDHPSYKDGRTLKKYYCIDCEIEISGYSSKRCQSCAAKERFKNPKNNTNYGKHHSLKTRNKISLALQGRKIPLEVRIKIGLTQKGKIISSNTRRKIGLAHKGKKLSVETRNKISLSLSGENHPNYGKKLSLEHRKNIGFGQIGRNFSSETRRKMSLSSGGTGTPYENSEYGAEFDSALKERVRFRDKYKCQECGCSQIENGRQLDVHHIDYNKKNNEGWNLISLCRSCHTKTNTNREFWIEYFIQKIKIIYRKINDKINNI